MKVLLSWIGSTDLKGHGEVGPICEVLKSIDNISLGIFLIDLERTFGPEWTGGGIRPNLKKIFPNTRFVIKRVVMNSCNDFGSIYDASSLTLRNNAVNKVYINMNSGSKIMCGSWMLAADRLPKGNGFQNPVLVSKDYGKLKYFQIN